jgi:hypothetical protein
MKETGRPITLFVSPSPWSISIEGLVLPLHEVVKVSLSGEWTPPYVKPQLFCNSLCRGSKYDRGDDIGIASKSGISL